MARPQKENGFTPVAHEILDEICRFKLSGSQFRIIMKVWRMTYGYNRKDHELSVSFLHDCTGLSESTVKQEVKALIEAKVLIEVKRATRSASRKLSFNKNYEEWLIPKSGDEMSGQMDLFGVDQVHDSVPNKGGNEVHDYLPNNADQVQDRVPNKQNEVHDYPPIKRNKDLKKKDIKEIGGFDQFYSAYPRKISRQAAERAWKKIVSKDPSNASVIIQNTKNFAETCKLLGTDKKYIPHPSTFLNQRRYEDYPVIDPEGLAAEKESRFGSNFNFLKNKIGGRADDGGTSGALAGEGQRGLPEGRT